MMMHPLAPYCLSQKQALHMDLLLVQHFGYDITTLMEVAGLGVASVVAHLWDAPDMDEIVAVVGKGNNGGDAWVAARYLLNWGYAVSVVTVADEAGPTIPQRLFEASGGDVYGIEESDASVVIQQASCVVDGLVGVGLAGPLRPLHKVAVDMINRTGGGVVSVDIPSGMHPDTGAGEVCVQPDHTVAIVAPKQAVMHARMGKLWAVNLGIPPEVYTRLGVASLWKGRSDLWMPL